MKRGLTALGLSLAAHAALLGPLWLLRPPPPPAVGHAGSVLKVDVVSLRASAAGAGGEARAPVSPSAPLVRAAPHSAATAPRLAPTPADVAAAQHTPPPVEVAPVAAEAPAPQLAVGEARGEAGAASPAGPVGGPGAEGAASSAPGGARAVVTAAAGHAAGPSATELDPGVEAALHQRLQAGAARCYPSASRRFHETGTSEVAFCVGASGRLTPTRVARSSGSDRLDRAALDCVVGGSEPFPAAEGRCFALPVRFGD